MATKAVAALLINKMAWCRSPSSSPLLPLLFLFGISELEQIGCDTASPPPLLLLLLTRGPSCPLTLLRILSLQTSIHTPHMWVSRSLQMPLWAGLRWCFGGGVLFHWQLHTVNQPVGIGDEKDTNSVWGPVKSLASGETQMDGSLRGPSSFKSRV